MSGNILNFPPQPYKSQSAPKPDVVIKLFITPTVVAGHCFVGDELEAKWAVRAAWKEERKGQEPGWYLAQAKGSHFLPNPLPSEVERIISPEIIHTVVVYRVYARLLHLGNLESITARDEGRQLGMGLE